MAPEDRKCEAAQSYSLCLTSPKLSLAVVPVPPLASLLFLLRVTPLLPGQLLWLSSLCACPLLLAAAG